MQKQSPQWTVCKTATKSKPHSVYVAQNEQKEVADLSLKIWSKAWFKASFEPDRIMLVTEFGRKYITISRWQIIGWKLQKNEQALYH